jgi:hypothetical protein
MSTQLTGVSYSSLEKAGMPTHLKSGMRAWIDRTIAAGGQTPESARSIAKLHAVAAIEGVRATGESAIVGGILGAIHATLPNGLDIPVKAAKMNIPADGAGAVLGLLASVMAAQEPHGIGRSLQQAGATCAAVFAFRKTNDLIVEMKIKSSGITPGGGAALPPKMSKAAVFAGEDSSFEGPARVKRGGVIGSVFGSDEDPIVAAARRL